jgi:hypothetical protein
MRRKSLLMSWMLNETNKLVCSGVVEGGQVMLLVLVCGLYRIVG